MPLPGKYQNLMVASERTTVPPTILLGESFFATSIENYHVVNELIERVLHKIQATSGAFLQDHVAELRKLAAQLKPSTAFDDAVAQAVGQLLLKASSGLAVRSAAVSEDNGNHSYAGLYKTLLGVPSDIGSIGKAVLEIWTSYFEYAAVAERLSAGSLVDGLRMNVMVQPLIPATIAGVAFSASPQLGAGAQLEFVEGTGDALVSGWKTPVLVNEERLSELTGAQEVACRQVFEAIHQLRDLFGYEVDVEWAFLDDQLYVLQVRPITTLVRDSDDDIGELRIHDLFGMSEQEMQTLRPLPAYVEYFRSKRGPLFKFAANRDVAVGGAKLVYFDNLFLTTNPDDVSILEHFQADQVILDVNDNMRQIVLPKAKLLEELRRISSASSRRYCVLIRDYLRGDVGVITRVVANDDVLVEYTKEGLLALNRGGAKTDVAIVNKHAEPVGPFNPSALASLISATHVAQQTFGPVQLEWVFSGDRLFLIDMSSLSDAGVVMSNQSGELVVSVGHATGPICLIEDSPELLELSDGPAVSLTGVPDIETMGKTFDEIMRRIQDHKVPPIVMVSRPYAALAPLIPHVAGFVFSGAAVLCHLAILLREKGVPAVASESIFESLYDGVSYTLDARP
ncbi:MULTISPECIES: PEP/pyruvate-binding domain-containing protein [unclassified Pseudomonas]|uniref:PEP/pyruvate-binding domain-containing protein n=1 Tax=unclassified Pseudomonas TaxID=196821 RepID=UPI0008715CAD|nr:Pyruvate phosphate dikinase, PEP/pyruvate binding domain [Pseudomonas sp. NFACC56-3]SFL06502.1 Pyruvate phosphate dikinase, PEP/pyruvate binding domain [Pseudomonas sp. NFACC52]